MLKVGPTISLQDFGWWIIAVAVALAIAGVGMAMHVSRMCALLRRRGGSARSDDAAPRG